MNRRAGDVRRGDLIGASRVLWALPVPDSGLVVIATEQSCAHGTAPLTRIRRHRVDESLEVTPRRMWLRAV